MSLFFEDEIQKVKGKTDRLGLDILMSQDPRDRQSKANKYRRTSHTQTFSNRYQYDRRRNKKD